MSAPANMPKSEDLSTLRVGDDVAAWVWRAKFPRRFKKMKVSAVGGCYVVLDDGRHFNYGGWEVKRSDVPFLGTEKIEPWTNEHDQYQLRLEADEYRQRLGLLARIADTGDSISMDKITRIMEVLDRNAS